jgi:hypothetical protein
VRPSLRLRSFLDGLIEGLGWDAFTDGGELIERQWNPYSLTWIKTRGSGERANAVKRDRTNQEKIMPTDAKSREGRIDQFSSGPGTRADNWRDPVEAVGSETVPAK